MNINKKRVHGIKNKKNHTRSSEAIDYESPNGKAFLILITFIILMIITLVNIYFYDYSSANSDAKKSFILSEKLKLRTDSYFDKDQYSKLVDRAKEITKKYKSFHSEISVHDSNVLLNVSKVGVISPLQNLVIGMAQDVDSKNFAVFCKSLRKVSSSYVLIFVNNPIPEKHIDIAKKSDVNIEGFNIKDLESMEKFHPSTTRWPLIYKYLNEHESFRLSYKNVLMIDVRDSYFQKDPFAFISVSPIDSYFFAFQGVESMSIRECGWNSGWIKDCFDETMLNKIGGNKIICSGVSIGSMDMVMTYLRYMNNIILSIKDDAIDKIIGTSQFPTCERNGVDQGVHNVLLHQGLLPNVKVFSQSDDCPVANMQAKLMKVRNQLVYNQKNVEVSIVHQYDRYEDLQKYLFSQFVDWF